MNDQLDRRHDDDATAAAAESLCQLLPGELVQAATKGAGKAIVVSLRSPRGVAISVKSLSFPNNL